MEKIHLLSALRCVLTFFLICGKSATSKLIWAEKNQMIRPSTVIKSNMGKTMASGSGTLYRLRNRNTGSITMLMKNAIMMGIRILLPIMNSAPNRTRPSSSMDLLTVKGKLFIGVKLIDMCRGLL